MHRSCSAKIFSHCGIRTHTCMLASTGSSSPAPALSPPPRPAGMDPQAAAELGGSALRLLHCLAASPGVAQTLGSSPTPLLPPLLHALQHWGLAGSVLALDTLQRALVRGNPCRDALVEACLRLGLVLLLLHLLDWRQQGSTSQVRPAVWEGHRCLQWMAKWSCLW